MPRRHSPSSLGAAPARLENSGLHRGVRAGQLVVSSRVTPIYESTAVVDIDRQAQSA